MKRRLNARRNQGSVAALAFVATVPLLAAIGGIAVDCMHFNDAKGELQRATDAAALAGAEDLINYLGTKNTTGTSVSTSNEEPVNFALQVAALNPVDGPLGLWQSGDRSLSATIRYDSTLAGPANIPNRCDVKGTIGIRSLFSQIFGNFGQTVITNSSAGETSLNTLYSYAPLLVSWVDPDPSNRILKNQAVNQPYTVEIKDNQASNSVWILNNNQSDKAIIDHIANPSNPGAALPPIAIGDWIKSDNGQKSAGKDFNLLLGKDVAFIVTGDNVGKDYLAKGKPLHQIIGYMVLHITSVDNTPGKNGYDLSGTLKPFVGYGTYNPTDPFKIQITTYAPFLVRLIQ
jgi:hypothetical protein